MKSIIARFTELKTNVAGTTDSEFEDLDYNKVDKALKSVGVSIKDAYGQFRNLDDVFLELAGKWSSLDRNTQRYIATVAAGSRQQSRFLALMEDYDRTLELVEVAQEANGRSSEQFAKNAESLEFKINKLKNTWEQFRINIVDADFFANWLDRFDTFLNKIKGADITTLLLGGLVGGTLVKNIVYSILKDINAASGQFKQIGNLIGKKISEGISSGSFNFTQSIMSKMGATTFADVNRRQANILQVANNSNLTDVANRYKTTTGGNISQLYSLYNDTSLLQIKLDNSMPITAKEYANLSARAKEYAETCALMGVTTDEVNATFGNLDVSVRRNINSLGELEERARINAVRMKNWASGLNSAIGVAGNIASSAIITGITTGGDWDAIEDTTKIMGYTMAISTVTKALSTVSAAALEAGEGIGVLEAAIVSLKAVAPEVLLVGAVIGAAIWGISAYNKYQKEMAEANKTTSERLEEQKKKVEELTTAYSNAAAEQKEAKKEYKDAEKLKQDYDELSKNVNKTTEEQERYKEIVSQIQDQFPEIVTYYDEVTGKLEVQNDLWDLLINKKREFLDLKARQTYSDVFEKEEAERQLIELENKLTTENRDKILLGFGLSEHTINTLSLYSESETTGNTLAWMEAIFGSSGQGSLESKSYLAKVSKEIFDTLSPVIGNFLLDVKLQDGLLSGEDVPSLLEAILAISSDDTDINNLDSGVQDIYNYLKSVLGDEPKTKDFDSKETIGELYATALTLYKDNALLRTAVEQVYTNNDLEATGRLTKSSVEGYINETRYLAAQLIQDDTKRDKAEQEVYKAAYKAKQLDKYLNEYFGDLLDTEIDLIQDFTQKTTTLSKNELANQEQDLIESLPDQLENIGKAYIDNQIAALNSLNQQLVDKDFTQELLVGSSIEEMEALANNLQAIIDANQSIPEIGRDYATAISDIMTSTDIDPEKFISLLSNIDWTKANLTNFNTTFLDNFLKLCEDSGIEGGEELYQKLTEALKKVKVIDLILSDESEVQRIVDTFTELRDKTYKEKDSLLAGVTEQSTKGFITVDTLEKIKKSFSELGLKEEEYITYTNGQIKLDAEKLAQYYIDSVGSSKEKLRQAIYDTYNEQAELIKLRQELIDKIESSGLEASKQDLQQIKDYETQIEQHAAAIEKEKEALEKAPDEAYINQWNRERIIAEEEKVEKLKELQKSVDDAQKKLNESLYGTEYDKNKLDPLYNYATALDRVTKGANKAKEALESLKETDNPLELLNTYLDSSHSEVVVRNAENEVIAQAIENYKAALLDSLSEKITELNSTFGKELSTNINDYISEYGDRLAINFSALNSAQLPNEITEYVESTVEQINKLSDQAEQNSDAIKAKEKELLEYKKKIRNDYIKLEDEVINTLKEKYEEEIKDTEDKNKALEDADNEYLDALEKAIKKQRELRDLANQYDDLAKKEARLALMERDTSGTRAADAIKLQEEIEKDRTKLLDDSVDRMIDELKDMYELQKETREAEVEYQKAVLDNAALVQEANAIINSWTGSEDALAWFYSNTPKLDEMSVTKLEELTDVWKELYNAKDIYEAAAQSDFGSVVNTTTEEIQKLVDGVSEALTGEGNRSLGEVITKVTDTIKSNIQALEKAQTALDKELNTPANYINFFNDEIPNVVGETVDAYNYSGKVSDGNKSSSTSNAKRVNSAYDASKLSYGQISNTNIYGPYPYENIMGYIQENKVYDLGAAINNMSTILVKGFSELKNSTNVGDVSVVNNITIDANNEKYANDPIPLSDAIASAVEEKIVSAFIKGANVNLKLK